MKVLEHVVFPVGGEVSEGVFAGFDGALGAEASIRGLTLLGALNKMIYFFR